MNRQFSEKNWEHFVKKLGLNWTNLAEKSQNLAKKDINLCRRANDLNGFPESPGETSYTLNELQWKKLNELKKAFLNCWSLEKKKTSFGKTDFGIMIFRIGGGVPLPLLWRSIFRILYAPYVMWKPNYSYIFFILVSYISGSCSLK